MTQFHGGWNWETCSGVLESLREPHVAVKILQFSFLTCSCGSHVISKSQPASLIMELIHTLRSSKDALVRILSDEGLERSGLRSIAERGALIRAMLQESCFLAALRAFVRNRELYLLNVR